MVAFLSAVSLFPAKWGPASALCQSPTTHAHLPGLGGQGPPFCNKTIWPWPPHTLRAPVFWSPWAQWGRGTPGPDSLSPRRVSSSTHCLTRSGPPCHIPEGAGAKESHPAHPAAEKERAAQPLALWKRVPQPPTRRSHCPTMQPARGPKDPLPKVRGQDCTLCPGRSCWGDTGPHGFAHISSCQDMDSRWWLPGPQCIGPKALI